jgi:hypothetical protein
MTSRPVFLPSVQPDVLFGEVVVSFAWHSGFAPSQKQKNVVALHAAAKQQGLAPLLEVSTKSLDSLGRELSAFNFEVGVAPGRSAPIELAYQASKVFSHGGPYLDLLDRSPREAKRDERLKASGTLVQFFFGGKHFPRTPMTAFYDWLFLRAFAKQQRFLAAISTFAGFTDIEFNPERSVNCQARSCAVAVTLFRRGLLPAAAKSFAAFADLVQRGTPSPRRAIQDDLPIFP